MMILPKAGLRHLNSIAHEGKVLVFGTDTTGRIYYTVKQDGFEDNYGSTELKGWENWQVLPLPNEDDDPSVIAKETEENTIAGTTDFILRSRYRTHNLTAPAPVQLVSGMGHLYVFRSATEGTVLVDRFVLDGITNKLVRKLDVRFKRSRQKYASLQITQEGKLDASDSLDFRDTDGNPFYEPTTELSLMQHLYPGWFAVVLVPTNELDRHRWHFFAYHNQTQQVELTSIRASAQGLFDVRDQTVLEPSTEEEGVLISRSIPGLIRRTLDLEGIRVTGSPTATQYDTQVERQTQAGPHLLREASKIMLVVPTDSGEVAALNFAVAADGTLAQLGETPTFNVLRNDPHEVLLPLNTLDQIKALGDSTPPPQGTIQGMERAEDDRVRIISLAASKLRHRDLVQIEGTQHYNGHYQVKRISDNTFEIEAPWVNGEVGNWEVIPEEENGLIFDGIITAVERTANSTLKVTSPNHGLEAGDEVQIMDTEVYNGLYPVTKIDGDRFQINVKWQPGEAVNLKAASRQRRGLLFDGVDDYLESPPLDLRAPQKDRPYGLTYSTWVYVPSVSADAQLLIGQQDGFMRLVLENGKATLQVRFDNVYAQATDTEALSPNTWVHYAGVFSYDPATEESGLLVCRNGVEVSRKVVKKPAVPEDGRWTSAVFVGGARMPDSASFADVAFFTGKMSWVQVWNQARAPKVMKDTMHLQLTGREVGLAGYWPLGAVVEGKNRKGVDFSIHGHDVTVHGGAYVSARRLDRTLRDGTTQAIRYLNDELFAVTQRATYVESFEFKTDLALDPNDIDGAPLFLPTYWGKRSRGADEQIPFTGKASNFEALEDGWHRATFRFTVPDGVALMRSFGITDLREDWKHMEIRKHRMQLVSNTVTEARYTDRITLERQADGHAASEEKLVELAHKEREEAILLMEKKALADKIAMLNNPAPLQAEVNRLRSQLITLKGQGNSLQTDYQREINNPLNYWCRIVNRNSGRGIDVKGFSTAQGASLGQYTSSSAYTSQQWRFANIGNYYQMINRRSSMAMDVKDFSKADAAPLGQYIPGAHTSQQWRVVNLGNDIYQFINHNSGRAIDVKGFSKADAAPLGQYTPRAHASQQWRLLGTGVQANDRIPRTYQAWQAKLAEIKRLEALLRDREALLKAGAADRAALEKRLAEVLAQLQHVQTAIATLHTAFIQFVLENQQTPQSMPVIAEDARGLATQGAVLAFVRPHSRVQATATAEGQVQLSYFDNHGRIRLTAFDATADSRNAAFEEWIPDGLRACPSFDTHDSLMTQENPLPLGEAWTIEAWFTYPLPETPAWNTLTCGKNADRQIIVQQGKKLGTFIDRGGDFYDSGYDLSQLSPGWHHLAAVGQGTGEAATTTFYINGRQVGQIQAKSTTDIYAIGNHQSGQQPFGKLAEIRVWETALPEDEIEINSKVVLSGNEPDLLVYYPLREASGAVARDHTGHGHNGTMQAVRWSGCTAPIGNPRHTVMAFDGANDNIEIPALGIEMRTFTFEAWVKADRLEGWQALWNDSGWLPGDVHVQFLDGILDFGINGNSPAGQRFGYAFLPNTWYHLAVAYDANEKTATLYVNGKKQEERAYETTRSLTFDGPSRIGSWEAQRHFSGVMSELRIWNRTRTSEEIKATSHKRLTGREAGLIGYWPLHSIEMTEERHHALDFTGNHTGTIHGVILVDDNALPIAGEAVVSAEYATLGLDPATGGKSAMMRRFLASPTVAGAQLLSGKRIEFLDRLWIGNAQFAPTLLGYIEGAPPVPSENLTEEDDYNGATSVELTMSEDVAYTWNREQEAGLGANVSLFAGISSESYIAAAPLGVGTITSAESSRHGFKGDLSTAYSFLNQSQVAASASSRTRDKIELRGSPEQEAKFETLGRRFVPKNVGYALVVSGLADVYILRLKRSKRMVSYQVLPNPDVPQDVNTITFLINPAYTMNGSLDGLTGTNPTSDRFFRHVPAMRAQYGSLYPASYFRVQETYDLKQQIEAQDKARAAFFHNFNAHLVDEASLDRQTRRSDDNSIGDAEREERQRQIEGKIQNQEERTHAQDSFAAWQRRMENLQIQAGKRNIVNTYVWDADGGLRSESQEFANTVEHTVGGSFSLEGAIGYEGNFDIFKVSVELTAQATTHLTQTATKTESTSTGLSLEADLSGVEGRGITDHNDHPLLPGEKVDRYRFLSFFLEGDVSHFHDFFSHVVDPEWLHSNDEEARALRQVMGGRPNKAWRVLHRVTYVERPALMGFGRDLRKREEPPGVEALLAQFDQLERDNKTLAAQMARMLELLEATAAAKA